MKRHVHVDHIAATVEEVMHKLIFKWHISISSTSNIPACVLYVLYLLNGCFGVIIYLTILDIEWSECYKMQHTNCG